jgi:hypothetical protein
MKHGSYNNGSAQVLAYQPYHQDIPVSAKTAFIGQQNLVQGKYLTIPIYNLSLNLNFKDLHQQKRAKRSEKHGTPAAAKKLTHKCHIFKCFCFWRRGKHSLSPRPFIVFHSPSRCPEICCCTRDDDNTAKNMDRRRVRQQVSLSKVG